MITCTIRYVIDPYEVASFEDYAKVWLAIIPRMGGTHHGYFLPHEGPNNIAYAMFSFDSLAAYENYRTRMADDPECRAAYALAEETQCILSYERSFTRPVLEGSLKPIQQS